MEEKPKFNKAGNCFLKGKDRKSVLLREGIWKRKIIKPERRFLQFNFEKIKETVRNPDFTRKSKSNKNSKILYKRFERIWILEGISAPSKTNYFVVVIISKKGKKSIQTIYTTNRIKK